jgi:hypothetical protein
MNTLPCLLAQADSQVAMPWDAMDPATREYFIVVASILLVTFLALLAAIIFRTKRRRRARHHHAHSAPKAAASPESPGNSEAAAGKSARRKRPNPILVALLPNRYKHRRRRPTERPMNPTLAQSGGLPPARPAEPPEGPT